MQINGSTIEIQLTAEPVFPHPSFLPYLYPSLLSSLLPFPMSLLPSFLPSQVSEWTLKSFCSSKKATLGKAGVSMLHLPPLRLRQGGDPHSLPMAKDWSMHPSWMYWSTPLPSYFALSHHLSARTCTGLTTSVSPEPFCSPAVFAFVANVFHISETLGSINDHPPFGKCNRQQRKNWSKCSLNIGGRKPCLGISTK